MRPFLPKKLAPVAFGFLLAMVMTFIISGVSNVITLGPQNPEFFTKWMASWLATWIIAFPVVLFVAPSVRRFIETITLK